MSRLPGFCICMFAQHQNDKHGSNIWSGLNQAVSQLAHFFRSLQLALCPTLKLLLLSSNAATLIENRLGASSSYAHTPCNSYMVDVNLPDLYLLQITLSRSLAHLSSSPDALDCR